MHQYQILLSVATLQFLLVISVATASDVIDSCWDCTPVSSDNQFRSFKIKKGEIVKICKRRACQKNDPVKSQRMLEGRLCLRLELTRFGNWLLDKDRIVYREYENKLGKFYLFPLESPEKFSEGINHEN